MGHKESEIRRMGEKMQVTIQESRLVIERLRRNEPPQLAVTA